MGPLFIVDGNKPRELGVYIVYTNGPVSNVADRTMLFWDGQHWYYPMSSQRYRDHVYGYIGPLPVLKLEEKEDG